jgi:enoyl-CoA hydratase
MGMKWLKSTETLTFDVRDSVAHITLNRPEKRNALSGQTLKELNQALLEADDRKEVNVILLSGTVDDDIWHLERQQDLTNIMLDIHKPIVCKIQGNCLAGGTDLAFSCDIVLAADDAKIGFPAARGNGTPPTNLWIYHCGPQWAKRMLFTGDTISGIDAARIGLALEAYPADEIQDRAEDLARRIANTDAEILATHKRVVNLQLELAGAKTSLRYVGEADARAHLSVGPRRAQFKKDMAEKGLKEALTNRDAPFGDSRIMLRARDRQPD